MFLDGKYLCMHIGNVHVSRLHEPELKAKVPGATSQCGKYDHMIGRPVVLAISTHPVFRA